MLVRRIGIDFGTSTTVFAYKDYDGKGNTSNEVPKLLELGGKVMFPSVVFEPDGEAPRVYGFDAEEESRIAEGTLYINFKMDLMSESEHEKACKLIEGFFKYLRNIYVEDCNRIGVADQEETWISYPAAWPENIRQDMERIAQNAGFVNIHTLDEPTAAINSVLYQYKDEIKKEHLLSEGKPANVLMIDMGAGTTDLVVCRFVLGSEYPVEKILSWPPADSTDYFGGREIDDRLTEYCIGYCQEHSHIQRDFQKMRKRMSRNIKKWKEGEFFRALQTERKTPVPEIVENNVPDVLERKDFQITDRQSFEEILGELLDTFPKIVRDCAEVLKDRPDGFDLFTETDLVILTGGNSSWYFIDEYLLGERDANGSGVGFARLQKQPGRLLRMGKPQQTVAYGLTLNEKLIKEIGEQFRSKLFFKNIRNQNAADEGKASPKAKGKQKELHYKKKLALDPVIGLVNGAAAAMGDPARFVGGKAVAGVIHAAIPKRRKEKLHNQKVSLLAEVRRQLDNIKAARESETNASEERKKLLETLESELVRAERALQSNLDTEI